MSQTGERASTPAWARAPTAEPTAPAMRSLQHAAELLGLDPDSLGFVLCYRQIKTGREWIDSPNSREKALELCESLTKGIYVKIFDWLCLSINR